MNFNGIIRPDHVPLFPSLESGHDEGEKAAGYFSGKASGYTMVGRIFAVGYLRGGLIIHKTSELTVSGLMDAVFGRALSSFSATKLKV